MKRLYPKSIILRLCIALIALCALIYGCRKEITNSKESTLNTDPAVPDAKTWYERTFPVMGGSNQTVHTNGNGTGFDLSQKVKPDWPHATRYTRLGKDVIEMPICPDSKFKSILKKKINNQAYSKSYTRSSYLLLKDVKGYKAYIMTIVADSSYIKGDPGKLANNTYRQHDADFSGLVLYFTPKGKYLNGYAYKNGQLVESGSAVQSQGRTRVQLAERCIDWYYDVYVNGVFVGSIYLYTTCNTPNPQDPGSSGSPAPPNRCDTQGPLSPSTPNSPSTPSVPTALSGHVVVNNVPGGGFPPPTDEDDPCDNVPSSSLHPIFGINNSNAIIPDANFDDLLNYLDTKGISYSNPYNVTVTINGIQYKGQYTDIYNPDGTVVHYFSPDISSGPFQIGMEYAIGTSPVSSNTVNTTISMDFGAVRVGSPSSYLGNGTVTYAPLGGSGGALLTAAQRQQLESSDNSRLLQLLQQEDAADDAAAGPCHGTARNGNVKWPGTLEHWLIQFDYIASNPLSLKEYYVPGSSGKLNGNPGYADIANPVTGEMFEIKPDNTGGQSAGVAEIQLYVTKANALCPRVVGGGWSAGGNYPSRSLPDPKNPANLLISRLFSNGVIVYASKPRNGLPQPVPIVLPENLLEKLKKLFRQIKENPNNMQLQIIAFVRQNPKIIPYLKSAAAVVVIGTILEDIASDGAGVLDDWQSFLIARALWRVSNGIVII